jgi:adenylosuccinate lyase
VSKEQILDVLADRYATAEMVGIFSARRKVILERELWIAVLKAQRDLGLSVPDGAIEAYERVINQVDFDSMQARERVTRHDVKARIEEFCALAGYEAIHRGMTSRDLTDNVEQLQIRLALELVRDRLVAVLVQMAERAAEYSQLAITGRTHNVAAQVTTLGKRLATAGEETLMALRAIEELLHKYPLRGLKGPVGTSQDMLELLGGDRVRLADLEAKIAEHLGFNHVLNSVGQIYPRSLDHMVVSALTVAAAGPSSLARTIRLMAGYELITEGFQKGQVGSSAMPHKINPRTSERINGSKVVLLGFSVMTGQIAGDEWQEGDVSDSIVRRVVFPGAFFTIDGLIESTLTVLSEFGPYPAVIKRELERYLPFLATTRVLMACVRRGVGRETAYAVIQEHAKAVALEMRESGLDRNDLFDRLGEDRRFPFTTGEIWRLIGEPIDFAGDAEGQVRRFCEAVAQIAREHPKAAAYTAGAIL